MNLRNFFFSLLSKKCNRNKHYNDEIVYTTPYYLNRWILLVVYSIVNSTTTYMYLGWARGLQDMLYRSGAYEWECSPNAITEEDYLPRCSMQQRKVGNLLTVLVSSAIISAVFGGMSLDFFGPKITATTGVLIDLCGWVMLAESHVDFIVYIPAMSLIGTGCNFVGMSIITVSRLFPERRRAITAVLTSTASFSMSFCIACNAIWQSNVELFTFRKIIWGYIIIECTMALPIVVLLVPWKAFSEPKKKIDNNEKSKSSSDNKPDFFAIGKDQSAIELPAKDSMNITCVNISDANFVEVPLGTVVATTGFSSSDITVSRTNNIKVSGEAHCVNASSNTTEDKCCNYENSANSLGYNLHSCNSCSFTESCSSVQSHGTCSSDFQSSKMVGKAFVICENADEKSPAVDTISNWSLDSIQDEICLFSHGISKNLDEQHTACTGVKKGFDNGIREEYFPKEVSPEERRNIFYYNCSDCNTCTLDTSTSLPGVNEMDLYLKQQESNRKKKKWKFYMWPRKKNSVDKRYIVKDLDILGKIKKNLLDSTFLSILKEKIYILSIFNFCIALLRNDFLYKTAYSQLGKEIYEVLGSLLPFMFVCTWVFGFFSQKLGPIFGLWVGVVSGIAAYTFTIIPVYWVKWLALVFLWMHMSFLQTSMYIFLLEIFPSIHFGKLLGIAYLIGGLGSLVGISMFDAAVLRFKRFLEMDLVILGCSVANFCIVAYISHGSTKIKEKFFK